MASKRRTAAVITDVPKDKGNRFFPLKAGFLSKPGSFFCEAAKISRGPASTDAAHEPSGCSGMVSKGDESAVPYTDGGVPGSFIRRRETGGGQRAGSAGGRARGSRSDPAAAARARALCARRRHRDCNRRAAS